MRKVARRDDRPGAWLRIGLDRPGHDAADPAWGRNGAKEIDDGHRGTHVTAGPPRR
jgi:hypothetical protein